MNGGINKTIKIYIKGYHNCRELAGFEQKELQKAPWSVFIVTSTSIWVYAQMGRKTDNYTDRLVILF